MYIAMMLPTVLLLVASKKLPSYHDKASNHKNKWSFAPKSQGKWYCSSMYITLYYTTKPSILGSDDQAGPLWII